MKQRTKCY